MGCDSDSPTPSGARPSQSGRKGSKKVRTGCITCKIRKVKCDEAKPFCTRCTKTGRRCDGYLDAKELQQRRRRTQTGQLAAGGACDPQTPLSLFFEWASTDEKRSFHFFQHVTAPCLSGDFDGAFWRVIVLQICQSEPAVKHAVLAVSSLHESMMAPTSYGDAEDRHSFALSQYNRAIACLLDQMRDVDARPLVPLLTCVLFVCIELMQNKDRESLLHLDQGRQILSQLGRKPATRSPEVDIIKQHLVPMYTRFSLTSWLIGGDPAAIPTPLKMLTDVPMLFDSIADVRYALYDLMDECLRFVKKTHAAKFEEASQEDMRGFDKEQDYLLRKIAKFNVAFSLYQSSQPRDAPPGTMALVQIHVHTTYIWTSTALSTGEGAFDSHVSTFSSIIPLAASFMDAVASSAGPTTGKSPTTTAATDPRRFSSMFTFEMHVIAPLYYVATKCRHPLIRRAALDLLRRNPARRENLWRANVMAAIADQTIRLEEKHLLMERSASPVGALPAMIPPFVAPFVPGELWESHMRDAPMEDVFRSGAASQPPATPGPPPPRATYNSYDATPAFVSEPSPSSGLDMTLGGLSQLPIDPSLLYDASDVAAASVHSISAAPSIASSFDEMSAPTIFVSGGGTAPASTMADMSSPLPPSWGHQPHQHQQQPQRAQQHQRRTQHQHQQLHRSAPGISLEPPTPSSARPHSHGDNPDAWPTFRTGSGAGQSTGISSHSHSRSSLSSSSPDELSILASAIGLGRSADAPFDVPERFRVQEAIIGPDKDDGLWVMMFRKLAGRGGDWDVTSEYICV
ncbi:hypothetical protein QBC34DRAFT_287340 [Podospora aff. communis PSN243]|uniref:Zn(2)-C6 fungal-type domain-containing protein n=1 Tax=Podospora aff. communis PSN243 TaxID=3040156 RepID=A0AAV9H6M7_9PEZI|nr:hypothetical protein QBC34DRAFT_287340 [Podospora aff. communis PSN243]